ncbi:MAG TPA: precorrin-8X methylmutase [Candidatus Tectomicrobia bacterium]|nr:precorrin-8X methylmutase [Candidatus Tectomicrobia bacterium]
MTRQSRIAEEELGGGTSPQDLPLTRPAAIQQESFRIIEEELGSHGLSAEEWLVARRVIHSTGDFEFAQLLQFHSQAFAAAAEAIAAGEDLLSDVEMVRMGIQGMAHSRHGLRVRCHLNDPLISQQAQAYATTRSAEGIRHGLQHGCVGICVVGNAPTALRAVIEVCEASARHRPRLIVGVPVGFVDAAESKLALSRTEVVPWITCLGRKGGSAVAAGIVNALLQSVPSRRTVEE